ncbi:hypothetical protein F4802DRAFT_602759 [Xylaria palmicola]|nr:hypothetical protein F4802DRAFT_602759 [Xylaria palmicola]
MNYEDPDYYYPYPTKGVNYSVPPWAGDSGGRDNDQHHDDDDDVDISDTDEDDFADDEEDLEDPMDADEDSPSPQQDTELDQGTFGVELEFLMVQCPRLKEQEVDVVIEDIHPHDTRWKSSKMAEWEFNSLETSYYMANEAEHENGHVYDSGDELTITKRSLYTRTKVTRVLRDKGLVAIKWADLMVNPEEEDGVKILDFSESEDSDDAREEGFANADRLRSFRSTHEYDPFQDPEVNASNALLTWQADYTAYHISNGLKIYRTRPPEIAELVWNQCALDKWPDSSEAQRLRMTCKERLLAQRQWAKQEREDERNAEVDPLHVPVPGLSAQYKAWTVTRDLSVDGNGMTVARYANTTNPDPFEQYWWYGAEVVSPVLAMGDERARQAIRDACGALRDELRCHKPMMISTGLHVHLGHTRGWTLFQAKKFATFWFLAESTIFKLHRKDRGTDMKWCAPIEGGSRLWRAMHSEELRERRSCARAVPPKHSETAKNRYTSEMREIVPARGVIRDDMRTSFLYCVWQYDSINALHYGLGENQLCRTGVKWRIRGAESSLDGQIGEIGATPQPGTIEVRIMQGTLDADHINNWVVVLEHIVRAVRDLSNNDFRDLLTQFLLDNTQGRLLALLGVPEDVRQYWLDPKRRDAADEWWEYPDRDVVDWNDPFMVPSHKATHGSYWD